MICIIHKWNGNFPERLFHSLKNSLVARRENHKIIHFLVSKAMMLPMLGRVPYPVFFSPLILSFFLSLCDFIFPSCCTFFRGPRRNTLQSEFSPSSRWEIFLLGMPQPLLPVPLDRICQKSFLTQWQLGLLFAPSLRTRTRKRVEKGKMKSTFTDETCRQAFCWQKWNAFGVVHWGEGEMGARALISRGFSVLAAFFSCRCHLHRQIHKLPNFHLFSHTHRTSSLF